MFFIKKLFLGLAAVVLIYLGGSGTQSSNMLFQGGGFIGIIVGLVVLYIFGKMVWRAMGCLPVLLIISLIVGFILYAIGAFNGGVDKVVPNVMNFLGRGSSAFSSAENRAVASQAPSSEDSQTAAPSSSAPLLSENFDDVGAAVQETAAMQPAQAPVRAAPQPLEEESGLSRLLNSLTGGGEPAAPAEAFNPNNYPAVYGVTRVINGDTLEMRGRYIKIYGIDAPESNQTCADGKGPCLPLRAGSRRWLKSWISGHELECHVLKQDSKGNMVATCALGQYDIGAALVNAGWRLPIRNKAPFTFLTNSRRATTAAACGRDSFTSPGTGGKFSRKSPRSK